MDHNRIQLQRSYVTVNADAGRVTHGGDQAWLSSEAARSFGCGLIAAADILRYLRKDTGQELSKARYLEEIAVIQKDFPVKGSLGITGFGLARRMNRMFRREGLPFRARWGMSRRRLESRIREMLSADIPVLLSVGPCFRHKKERLPLYHRKTEGKYEKSSGMRDHYVTVTGWEQSPAEESGMMEISSWGEKYYVNYAEYEAFVKKNDNFLFSNILYIRRKVE